jgi:hypothetical protein
LRTSTFSGAGLWLTIELIGQTQRSCSASLK